MSKEIMVRGNTAVANADNHDTCRRTSGKTVDEKYQDQFMEFVLDGGRSIITIIKGNVGDYRMISEDKNISSVDKAIAKRVIQAVDIGLFTVLTRSMIILVKSIKKSLVS